ncbi:MerR family transcriptional regulator [Shouchella patagoniensis]|uniref:MerR family transcriptional regulator n=1 Tax=Shouchella patagoniensis TaxID=228576 RepID=UPI000994FF0E|nr:MerR family transcriptional regulator [Shouchella patagoniensis]
MITVGELAERSSVTTRTLRYYDSIGLLKPRAITRGKHRLYYEEDLLMLAQIQLLKRMGFSLKRISGMMHDDKMNTVTQLENQLSILEKEEEKICKMRETIRGIVHAFSLDGRIDWSMVVSLIKQAENKGTEHERLLLFFPKLCEDSEETKRIIVLVNDTRNALASGPDSEMGVRISERLFDLMSELCQGDKQLIEELWDIVCSHKLSEALGCFPIPREIIEFWEAAKKEIDS